MKKRAATKWLRITALAAGSILILLIVLFITLTRIAQDNTGGIGTQYIRNNRPSFLSTVIFGILSIKKHVQPLTLASMEASNRPLTLKPSYAGATVQRAAAGDINLVSVCADHANKSHIIYFMHGGAWASGLNDRYVTFAVTLSQKTGYCLLMPEYDLLPAKHFPTQLDELAATYTWILQKDAPSKVIFGGDSSGATLSASLIFLLEQQHQRLPDAQFLFSPLADLSLSSPTFQTRAAADPLQSKQFVQDAVNAYVENDSAELKNPLVSPIYGNFQGYPPTIIEVASQEIFLGDSLNLYNKILAAGTPAKLDVWKGLWHAFPIVTSVPESRESLSLVAQFIAAHN